MRQHFINSGLLGIIETKAVLLPSKETKRKRQLAYRELARIVQSLYLQKSDGDILYMGFGTNHIGDTGLIVVTNGTNLHADVSTSESKSEVGGSHVGS